MATGDIKILRENETGSFDEIKLSDVYTASDVLSKLLTVDGESTDLDADLLDGHHASEFVLLSDMQATRNNTYIALEGQTLFIPLDPYVVGAISVYYNGAKLNAMEFIADDTITVILNNPAKADAVIEIVSESTLSNKMIDSSIALAYSMVF